MSNTLLKIEQLIQDSRTRIRSHVDRMAAAAGKVQEEDQNLRLLRGVEADVKRGVSGAVERAERVIEKISTPLTAATRETLGLTKVVKDADQLADRLARLDVEEATILAGTHELEHGAVRKRFESTRVLESIKAVTSPDRARHLRR